MDAELANAMRDAGLSPELAEELASLARSEERSLDPYLLTVEEPVQLPETQATCRCHFVAFGGNDLPMTKQLVRWLVAQAVDYCIPRSRIREAKALDAATNSTEGTTRLAFEAAQLFTKLKTSGEGGEMLLYLLLEVGMGLPQLLCKMPLKTDENMHVHGTDGIHGELLDNGNLALYWGESKLYKSANSAIDNALAGISPFLKDPDGEEARRDILLLRDHLDLDSPDLTEALSRYFKDGTGEHAMIEARGAVLVGSSLEDYRFPLEDDRVTVTADAAALIENWRSRVGLKIDANGLGDFELEVFFVPFPDVQEFRDEIRSALGVN